MRLHAAITNICKYDWLRNGVKLLYYPRIGHNRPATRLRAIGTRSNTSEDEMHQGQASPRSAGCTGLGLYTAQLRRLMKDNAENQGNATMVRVCTFHAWVASSRHQIHPTQEGPLMCLPARMKPCIMTSLRPPAASTAGDFQWPRSSDHPTTTGQPLTSYALGVSGTTLVASEV